MNPLDSVLKELTHGDLLEIAKEINIFKKQGILPSGVIKDKYLRNLNKLKQNESIMDSFIENDNEYGKFSEGDVIYDTSEHCNVLENMQMLLDRLSDIIINDYIILKNKSLNF